MIKAKAYLHGWDVRYRTRLKRVKLFSLSLLIFFSFIASITLPTKVNAQAGGTLHPVDAAKAYQAYWAFYWCNSGSMWHDYLDSSNLRDGDIIQTQSQQYRPTFIRASRNGMGNCHNARNMGPIFNDMGISDPLEFLASSHNLNGQSVRIYNPNGSSYERNTNLSPGDVNTILGNYLRNLHGATFSGQRMDPNFAYFVLKEHILAECIEEDNVSVAAGGTEIKLVNNGGEVETRTVLIKDRSYHPGYGITKDANDTREGPRVNCRDMASSLNSSADGAIQAIQFWRATNPDAEIPADNSTVTTEEDNSCETNSGVLGWIMCPVAGVLDSIVGFLDEQIRGQLHLREDYFRDNGNGNPVKDSWTQLRNIAYVILVPIMLVMVIGTALGFEVFSAYTIQKALPRMAIAVIFIALSWYICLFMVDLFNVMGAGIKGLITGPFSISNDQAPLKAALTNADVISQGSNTLESISSGITTGGLAVVGTVAAWSAGALSIGVIMSTLATAALVLGGVFLLLVARQIILIALFLLAPLAILSWIFPGNDKMWKLWWGSFSKLLMLFPLIMLLLGVGEVFAHITGAARSAAGQNQLVTTVIVIGSFIMPFFFIPFAFKWAGGVFGNLAGMVNDSERGLLDRLKKGRSNMRERNIGNAKNFGRFKGTNRFTRGLNNLGGMATNRPGSYVSKESLKGIGRNKGLGRLGIDTDKLDGVRQAGQAVKAAEDLKNDKVYQTNQNDDKFLLALANRNHAVRMRDNALKEGDQAGAAAWSSALTNASLVKSRDHAGTKLAAISAHAATGYNLSPGQVGYNELAGSVIDALGVSQSDVQRDDKGNITGVTGAQAGNFASAMNQAQYNLKNAGRTDLGGINNGAGLDIKSGVRKLSNYQRGQGKKDTYHGGAGAWLGASAVDSETGKTAETAAEVARGIEASLASGQTTEDSIVEWHSMLLRDYHSATDANKLEIQKQIDAMESVRIVGDPTDISRGGNSNLVAKLAANRAALSREGTANIDPSEMEPK